ncbi:MAG: DUF669 domain-containing protein [Gammaproteobacteria bacterium]|jgi:hypothetical protein|nr:DUF669 domain-containing protein [Gammaproteobacteria bacterium]
MGNLSGFYQNYGSIKENSGTLPPGTHNVGIESAEAKATKNDANQGYLELKLKVMDGQYAGMYAPSMRLNLWNASEKAREIAEAELKSITIATGAGAIDDSSQLVGKMMQVTVRPQKNDPQYSESVNPKPYNSGPALQQNGPGGGQPAFAPQGGQQAGYPPQGQQTAPQGGQPGFNPGAGAGALQGAAPAFVPSAAPQAQEQQAAWTPGFRP